ncbi:hypothetical protein [Roseibium marinum]|uniref:Zincin-like metallopeptidase toxin 3 of polymorphic toxin system n=1 Tax=Roseibium marinum TaxID=281252 RepID=A0A2S3UPU0_9HYPH|nr:hypothetical protein [Roseibium marinum]POF29737.1 zincin-like metallopeptidase toxin 3 of polymorphic toxin system [Roseibium marinum]
MMFFQDGEFPVCADIIRNKLIGLEKSDPKVFSALVECIESAELARQAVTAGRYPRVNIVNIIGKTGHPIKYIGGMYSGECDPEVKNLVYVNRHVASGIERDPDITSYFERTLLHEVVHWGRFIAGKSTRIDDREAGSHFEEKAYGLTYIGHHGFSCS